MKLFAFFLMIILTHSQDSSVVGYYQVIDPERQDIIWVRSDGNFIYQEMGEEYMDWVERSGTWKTNSDTLILKENRIRNKFYEENDSVNIISDTLMVQHLFIISRGKLKMYSTDIFDKLVLFDKKQ
ncbi:hypothetical protein [Gilvibacter sp.]|uniref:hypothetical protein n=1 Tax=Gilvibacter sp. TaxID=2729997 RepID=UPI003B51C6C4